MLTFKHDIMSIVFTVTRELSNFPSRGSKINIMQCCALLIAKEDHPTLSYETQCWIGKWSSMSHQLHITMHITTIECRQNCWLYSDIKTSRGQTWFVFLYKIQFLPSVHLKYRKYKIIFRDKIIIVLCDGKQYWSKNGWSTVNCEFYQKGTCTDHLNGRIDILNLTLASY